MRPQHATLATGNNEMRNIVKKSKHAKYELISNGSLVGILAISLIVSITTVFFTLVLPHCRIYPWSDEWSYLAPMIQPRPSYIGWLFAQHVDHRIPIQKILHEILLKATAFDFRSLIALNIIVSAFISFILIYTYKIYRGYIAIGDLAIPLCIMSFGSGFSQWGFEFQFLSTLLFSSTFLLFATLYSVHSKKIHIKLAITSLIFCSLCGLNGMIVSTSVLVLLCPFLICRKQLANSVPWFALGLALLINVCLWLAWTPSAASNGHAPLRAVLNFSFKMLSSPWIVYNFTNPGWKLAILLVLCILGVVTSIYSVFKTRSFVDFSVFAMLVSAIALIGAVAWGRSKEMSWHPGLEMHYGTLAILVPIASWMAVSKVMKRSVIEILGFALASLFSLAFYANYQWRIGSDQANYDTNLEAEHAIFDAETPQAVAREHMSVYFFVDTPQTQGSVAEGITLLRSYRAEHQK